MSSLPDKIDKIRIAVGEEEKPRSSLWVAWHHKNDFYLGARSIAGSIKVSLHASGICRIAFTEPYHAKARRAGFSVPQDRSLTSWKRAPTPASGAVHVGSIVFPTDYLRGEPGIVRMTKFVASFKPAPAGQAVQIEMFYSRESPATLEAKFCGAGILPMFYSDLPSGEFVSIGARNAPFDKTELGELGGGPLGEPNWLQPDHLAPGTTINNLSAMLFNKPADGQPFRIWDVNGLSMSRGQDTSDSKCSPSN